MDIIPENIVCQTELKEEIESFLNNWFSNDLTIQASTSGSTGKPQEIHLTKKGVQYSAQNTVEYFKLNQNTKALLCLPLSTIGGKMMIIRALESNMKLWIQKASSNPLNNMIEKIDFLSITPMQLNNILNDSLDNLKKISTILVGGAPIHAQLESRLKKEGISVYHSYGMTETASHVALRCLGFNENKYYRALPGISFDTNEMGSLIIHYPAMNEQPIHTNDIVELINESTFEWIGRADFAINTGGIKVHPEEIESKIADQISTPFFITSIPDLVLGEKVVLIIEAVNSKESFDFDFLGKQKPREVYFVKNLIYTHSGKLDRVASSKLILPSNK